MVEAEDVESLILVSFVLRHVGSSWHRPSCRSVVLAAAGQRMQGYSGLYFLSAMIPLLAVCFVGGKRGSGWNFCLR